METNTIIALAVIVLAVLIPIAALRADVKSIKLDASLFAFTQNLAQEKTKQCERYSSHIQQMKENSAQKSLKIAQLECRIKQYQGTEIGEALEALRLAEAKNEAEYKRGWDDCLDEQKSGKLEIEGGLPAEEAEINEC